MVITISVYIIMEFDVTTFALKLRLRKQGIKLQEMTSKVQKL